MSIGEQRVNTETVIKNILWRPEEAFKAETLEKTFAQSLIAFVVLALLTSAVTTADRLPKLNFLAHHPRIAQAPHITALVWFFVIFLGQCTHMWFMGLLLRWNDHDVNVKTLITGALWIFVVTLPLGWVLYHIFFRWFGWVFIPYRLWLMTICVRCVTGLSTKSSFWIYVLSLALLIAGFVILALIIALSVLRTMRLP
jgi:hypothetical protein